MSLINSNEWRQLQFHAAIMGASSLNEMFEREPERAHIFSREALGLYFDFSKQKINEETLQLLVEYAKARQLGGRIQALFQGQAVNFTEKRAAMHMALRMPTEQPILVEGKDVMPEIYAVKTHMVGFAHKVRVGEWRGATGGLITDVVNIGIGGSELGPRMVCTALAGDGPRVHFISNVDGMQLHDTLSRLQAEHTLFIVVSKTFSTQETLINAQHARHWLVEQLGESAVEKHFAAVSTNISAATQFGIDADHVFGFWDWVGGRYSLWGAVGLSILIANGEEVFNQLLTGAHDLDRHFKNAPLSGNLPVLMALLTFWNRNFLGFNSHVLAPYSQRLSAFPAWAQQLEMESNGKSFDKNNKRVGYATTPVLWGDVGTNSQHAFFQMLHQGTDIHPVDFILPLSTESVYSDMHQMLIANCFAQSAALMRGKTGTEIMDELIPRGVYGEELDMAVAHRSFEGNRPSSTLLLPKLDAYYLGMLLALYEHRTFVLSVLWDINAFDQWGVELGKQLCQDLLPVVAGNAALPPSFDSSTRKLLLKARQYQPRLGD
jgi:glucose-6-phosphate isomerase